MKGFRFYEEFENARKTKPTGNVIALVLSRDGRPETFPDSVRGRTVYLMEAVAAIFDVPNSDVISVSVSRDQLSKRCKRVPETRARTVHPRLFEHLDVHAAESPPAG